MAIQRHFLAHGGASLLLLQHPKLPIAGQTWLSKLYSDSGGSESHTSRQNSGTAGWASLMKPRQRQRQAREVVGAVGMLADAQAKAAGESAAEGRAGVGASSLLRGGLPPASSNTPARCVAVCLESAGHEQIMACIGRLPFETRTRPALHCGGLTQVWARRGCLRTCSCK